MKLESDLPSPRVVIIRHSKERKSKCSLQPLVGDPSFAFYVHNKPGSWHYVSDSPLVRLSFDGPLLSPKDLSRRLLIVDATWRYAQRIVANEKIIACEPRSLLSEWKTAYARRQLDCEDPERGLASVEALFASFMQMGQFRGEWLDRYYWKKDFLEKNAALIEALCQTKGVVY